MNTDRRFLFMTAGLLLLFSIAVMINATINFRNFSIQSTEQKAELTADIVKEGLTTMMVNGTIKDRDLFLGAIRSPESIRHLWVIRSQKVIDEYGPGLHREKPHDAIDRQVLETGQPVKQLTERADRVFYRITIPYIASSNEEKDCLRCHHVNEGDVLGAISIEFDITDTRIIGLTTLFRIGLITLLFLLAAIFVVKRLSRPYLTFFKELRRSLSRVKEGDFSQSIYCDTRNSDIRESATLYNTLIKKFQDTIGSVENRLSSLLRHNPTRETDPLQKAADTIDTLSKIQRFKQTIENDRSLEQIYGHLADVIRMELGANHFVIYAVNPRRNTREIVYSTLKNPPCSLKSLEDADACRAFRTETLTDSTEFPTVCPLYAGEFPYYFCLPFHIHQSAIVIMILAKEAQTMEYYKGRMHLLQNYLENARPVIESRILMRQLHEKSLKDGLTGIYNRKFLEELVVKISSQSKRGVTPYAVLMLDIDRFKSVNDTYGHSAGDMVIRKLAEIILDSIRKADIAARYGGEEFVVLLHKSSLEGGRKVAEKIRARFEATAIDIGEETIRCTVSIGIARYPDQGDTLKEVIALADTALYRAKHSGRNRIVVFNEEGEAPAPESVGPPPNPDDRPA